MTVRARAARPDRARHAARAAWTPRRRCGCGSRTLPAATRCMPRSSSPWVPRRRRPRGAADDLNALLGARLDRLPRPRSGPRSSAARSRASCSTATRSSSSPSRAARPSVPAGLDDLYPQGPDPPRRGGQPPRRRARRVPLQAHPRARSRLPRQRPRAARPPCTSATPTGSSSAPAHASAEYAEIIGYHLEQAYRYRDDLGIADDARFAVRSPPARRAISGWPGRRRTTAPTCAPPPTCSGARRGSSRPTAASGSSPGCHLAYAVDQTGLILEARKFASELYERAKRDRRARPGWPRARRLRRPIHSSTRMRTRSRRRRPSKEVARHRSPSSATRPGSQKAKRRLGLVYRSQGQRAIAIPVARGGAPARKMHATTCPRAGPSSSRSQATCNRGRRRSRAAIARCVRELREAAGDDRVLEAAVSRNLSVLLRDGRPLRRVPRARTESRGGARGGGRQESVVGIAEHGSRTPGFSPATWPVPSATWSGSGASIPLEDGKTQLIAIARQRPASRTSTATRDAGRTPRRASPPATSAGAARAWCWMGSGGTHRGTPRALRGGARPRAAHRRERRSGQTQLNSRAETRGVALAEVQRAAGPPADADESIGQAVRLYEEKGNVAAIERSYAAPTAVA